MAPCWIRCCKVTQVVAIDTNMLLAPFQFGIDVFEEIQRLVPGAKLIALKGTVDELNKIADRGEKEKKFVALAKKLLEVNRVELVNKEGAVDSELLRLARGGVIIATNDKELKKRIWKAGGRVIAIRGKNRLELF